MRNPNIEWILSMEEKQRKQRGSFTSSCVKSQFRLLRMGVGSSNQVPRAMFSSPSYNYVGTEMFFVDSGASLHMISKSDLTLEEEERFKS